MTVKKPGEKSIGQVADETRDRIIAYYRENTVEDDARREAERDARVKAALGELRRQGKLPPPKSKQDAPGKGIDAPGREMSTLSRLGPAPAPMVCALLVGALAVFGALVPIGFPSRTLDLEQTFAIILCAAALASWAFAVGAKAWHLSRVEGTANVLVRPFSSAWGFNVLFSLPFIAVVPGTSLAVPALMRGGQPGAPALIAALIWIGLLALREKDKTAYVREGRVHVRAGWLWVRRESAPVAQVRGVRVDRDSYRCAPSYVVKLDIPDAASWPRLLSMEARFRSVEKADAEAGRWRQALEAAGRI